MIVRKYIIAIFIVIQVFPMKPSFGLERVTECTGSHGVIYDQLATEHSWMPDNLTKLSIIFVKQHTNELDIIIRDSVGDTTIKASSKGYQIIIDDDRHTTLTVNTAPLGIFEIFQLKYFDNRKASLVWTISKNGAPPHGTTSLATYAFDCKY